MGARSVLYLTCMFALAAWGATPGMASISYGDLNNFDVFNDTTQNCHGFEIELDGIHSTDITYTFDWNHYGTPTITEDNSDPMNPKVFVRYAAKYDRRGLLGVHGGTGHDAVPDQRPHVHGPDGEFRLRTLRCRSLRRAHRRQVQLAHRRPVGAR